MIINCHRNHHNHHTWSDIHPQLFGMLCDTTLDKMYTLSIHAIFFSVIRIQSSTWTTNIIIILCLFFPSLWWIWMVWVVLLAQTEKIPLQKDCFWSAYVMFCSHATEAYPWWHLWIYVYYHQKTFLPHCHLDLCFQWQETEQLLHLEIAALLKGNKPVFAKLLHTVADWKAPR